MLRQLSSVQNRPAPALEGPPRIPTPNHALENRNDTGNEGGVIDRLLIRLQDLPLPARVRGCLARLGLERVGDLVRLSSETLLEQRGFGQGSLRALTRIMARLRLELGTPVDGWPPPNLYSLSSERHRFIEMELRRIFIPRDGGRLEDELRQLAAPAGSPRNLSVVVRYLGWDGRGGATLEAVGREHRISRQRALQIVKRVRRQYQRALVVPPRLKRCLLAATPRLAENAGDVEERLYRAQETNSRFRLEGILTAAATFHLTAPIELFQLGSGRVVAKRGEKARVLSIVRRAGVAVGRRGAGCVGDISDWLDGEHLTEDIVDLLALDPRFEWLGESSTWFWFRPSFAAVPGRTENRLVNQIMKALRDPGVLDIGGLWSKVSRSSRTFHVAMPRSVFFGICCRIPWCTVRDDLIARSAIGQQRWPTGAAGRGVSA